MSLQKVSEKSPYSTEHLPEAPQPGLNTPAPEEIRKESRIDHQLFRRFDFIEGTQFMGGPQKRSRFKLALWTWSSMVVDHCLILAMTCLFLLTGSLILKTTLNTIIHAQDFIMSGMLLYILLSFGYFVISRAFIGATLGEYSCGLRLGAPNERLKKSYALKVFIRSFVTLATGVILLPLLSLVFRKDLSGKISGISIYSLK